MTNHQHNFVVSIINTIASNPSYVNGNETGVSYGLNFKHHWFVNNEDFQTAEYSVIIDSFDDALEIIAKFSGDAKETFEGQIRLHNSFDESKPLYLHYQRSIQK